MSQGSEDAVKETLPLAAGGSNFGAGWARSFFGAPAAQEGLHGEAGQAGPPVVLANENCDMKTTERTLKKPRGFPGGAFISPPRVWLLFPDIFPPRRQIEQVHFLFVSILFDRRGDWPG